MISRLMNRWLAALAFSVLLACSDTHPASGVADSTDSTESAESTESEESTDATKSTESMESTESTTGSEESTESLESGSTSDELVPDLPMIFDPNEDIPPLDEEGCPGIYAQDLLPTFELTLEPEVWDMLVWVWLHGQELEDQDEDYHPEYPVQEFVYGDIVIHDAMIRLRGNPSNWDADNKMQFQIDFNEIDKQGRFLGLRHLPLEAASANRHMLRDRLALWIMRDMGIDAPCANHARLDINGEYYGLFTSLEKIDKTYLERVFDDPTGDLWKRANWTLKTNEDTTNNQRLEELKDADSIAELEDYLDLERSLPVFAAGAIIPDSDGMWAGGLNFYLYDEPISGKFVLLPWDLDNTFERFKDPPDGDYPVNPDPVVWEKSATNGRPFYDIALADPDWFQYYIDAIEDQFDSSYGADELHERIDAWTEQIEDSVFEDVNKPYSNDLYLSEVEDLHDYIDDRHEFLDDWLVCWQLGGEPNDEGYCVVY